MVWQDLDFDRFYGHFAPRVRRWISPRVASAADVDDLLQQTFIQAWQQLRAGSVPQSLEGWLRTVARNRCIDHYRGRGVRERLVSTEVLATCPSRHGAGARARSEALEDLMDALAALPPPDREVVRLHYLEGLSTREIAERLGCPQGTVKRWLHDARMRLRMRLGITVPNKTPLSPGVATMHLNDTPVAHFPARRPFLQVECLSEQASSVTTSELLWRGITPEIGRTGTQAFYAAGDGRLEEAHHSRVATTARVHGREGCQIQIRSWDASGAPRPDWSIVARLQPDDVECLATLEIDAGSGAVIIYTSHDEDFDLHWGRIPRCYEPSDQIRRVAEATYEAEFSGPICQGLDGHWAVTIGGQRHRCVRLVEFPSPELATRGMVADVGYLDEQGRAIWGAAYVSESQWPGKALDLDDILSVNGLRYARWRDMLTGFAVQGV